MKKLMLLGGSRYLIPVIKKAHLLGIYTITADYLPNNIAHKYSDEYVNVSVIDKDEVLKVARRLEIDGVMSFACDPGVVTAAYVSEKMGLPSVGPYESVCILQNKGRFRDFLKCNGFAVPKAKSYIKVEDAMKDIGLYKWPIIVKPTDSAGSKGVTRVDTPEKLKSAISYALSYSICQEFIIEEFITQKGYSSDSDCFSVEGKLEFVSFNCQRFDSKAKNPYTPAAYSWPTTMTNNEQMLLKKELQRLIKLLNMRTSIYNVETRVDYEGNVYIMEMSPRGGGNRLSECLKYVTGADLILNMVKYSVGLEIDDVEEKTSEGYWAEIVLHGDRTGVFDGLWIADDITNNVVEKDVWVSEGEMVKAFEAANESVGTLILFFKEQKKMLNVLDNIQKYVKVKIKEA